MYAKHPVLRNSKCQHNISAMRGQCLNLQEYKSLVVDFLKQVNMKPVTKFLLLNMQLMKKYNVYDDQNLKMLFTDEASRITCSRLMSLLILRGTNSFENAIGIVLGSVLNATIDIAAAASLGVIRVQP